MTKFSIHFDNEFCRQAAKTGVSRKLLLKQLKLLRENPDLGEPVSPQFPSYRVWRVLIGRVSVVDIGYLVAEELQDIEMSFILKVENDEPPSSKKDTVDKLIDATQLVATLAKIVRDFILFLT